MTLDRNQYEKQLRARNPAFAERQRENSRKWARANPEMKARYDWAYHIQKAYGISVADYEEMRQKQGGRCKICKRPPKKFKLAVDHCHKTGKVRGLLCASCNRALGIIENHWDDIHSYLLREGEWDEL
jgi:hypothetical protein